MTRVAIRADASRAIGHGHVMRCLTLAEALRAGGAEVHFICREHDGNLCDLLESRGMGVSRLPVAGDSEPSAATPGSPASLGATPADDARDTARALLATGQGLDWLVVDHYAIDAKWERDVARATGARVLVIDDMANRPHDCAVLLDQNLVGGMERRYDGLVPDECVRLLGPRFALLQPVYADAHRHARIREGAVRRIVIFFGGADADDMAGRALDAVLSLPLGDLEVDVVLAAGDPRVARLRDAIASRPAIRLHAGVPSLAPLLAAADLAIAAGGASSWERLCVGLPSLVVTLAENQRPIALELDRLGLVRLLGDHHSTDSRAIAVALAQVLSEGLPAEWSRRCLAVLDGRGAGRVAEALAVNRPAAVRCRSARVSDEAVLLKWANDPETRRNAFSEGPISPEGHHAWFAGRLANLQGCRFYIGEGPDGLPVGQVRFEREEAAWVVDYSVSPSVRGRGLGRPLMAAALACLREAHPQAMVVARVKESNVPSRRVFEALGFGTERSEAGVVEFRSRP